MFYDQIGSNRKWKIQDGSLLTSTHISVCNKNKQVDFYTLYVYRLLLPRLTIEL